MEKSEFKKLAIKNIDKYFLFLNLFFTYFLVRKYSNHLEPFEDEMTSLLSGVSFLQNLDFDGSPLITGNYSPYLTSGPVSSIGSGLGWLLTENLIIARIFNFYFLVLLTYVLLNITNLFKHEGHLFKLNIVLLTFTLLPWWYGSLYSLGEMFSSALFAVSILLIKTNKNLAIFIMGFSIIFGKLIQILLVIPFLFTYLIIIKKINFYNLINFLMPFFIFFSIAAIKTNNFNFVNYVTSYTEIIYNHQSSGLKIRNLLNIENFLYQLNSSEFSQWTLITKMRVLITPIIFSFILFKERKSLKILFDSTYPLIFSILFPYAWFVFLSQTKWIRYSQHYLYLILLFSIILLFTDKKLSKFTYYLLVFNISLFLSSGILLIIFLSILSVRKNRLLFKKLALILLILNSLNLVFESQNLPNYNLNFETCKASLSSITCVEEYLPYKLFK